MRIRQHGAAVPARPRDPADDARDHERREAEPDRRTGERPRAGVGVAGLGAHGAHHAGLQLPLDDVGGHLVAVGRRHLAGKRHAQRHVGIRIVQRRQVGPAFEDHQVACAAQRDVDTCGVAVHVRELRQFGEGQVGEHRLRPDVVVALVGRDRHLVAERQRVEQLRPLVVVVARLGGGDDLPGHPVVGGHGDRRPHPHAARRPSGRSATAATAPAPDCGVAGGRGSAPAVGHPVIVPDAATQSGSDRPRIANGLGSPAKW